VPDTSLFSIHATIHCYIIRAIDSILDQPRMKYVVINFIIKSWQFIKMVHNEDLYSVM
jgi:hypothetical protein